jgi:predicted nucleic acid-binding protein
MPISGAWVVDASVILKWYLRDEDFLDAADGFFRAFTTGQAEILVPVITRYEVANGLVVASLQGRVSKTKMISIFRNFVNLGIGQGEDNQRVGFSAMEISRDYPITFYDSLYLALSNLHSCRFVTADRRLYHNVSKQIPNIVWIGDVT